VSEDLLKEIKVFSNIGDLSEDELTKSALRKTLEYMDDDLFRSSQADLTIAFLEMGFSKLAEWILDDPRGSQTQEYLEKKWYLKIQCMLENGDIHKCLDYINEEILTESLGGNDYICFLYMKAEVLRHLGQRLEALKVYKSVSQINPRYRLVRIRLQESV
jgi:tetratricopeptide (TPR) repeat protein